MMKTFVVEYSRKFHDNSLVPREAWVETVVEENEERVKEGSERFEDIKRGMRSSFYRFAISHSNSSKLEIKEVDNHMVSAGAITLSELIDLKNKRLENLKMKGTLEDEEEAIFIKNILDCEQDRINKDEADEIAGLLIAYEKKVLDKLNNKGL